MGVMREVTGNFALGLGVLAAPLFLSALISWFFRSAEITRQGIASTSGTSLGSDARGKV
jgi:hypothetical protein